MFRVGKSIGAFVAVLLAAVALAAPASAAVRYAAPSGSGASPCNPTPCSLDTAVSGAVGGDEVVLTPGIYTHPDGLKIEKAISFGGQPGQPATLRTGAAPLEVKSDGAVVHDLRVELSEMTMATPLSLSAGTVERVYADPGDFGGSGCIMETGTLRDSVCRDGLSVSPERSGSLQAHIANVTANPVLVASSYGGTMNVDLLNTIALPQGTPTTSPSGLQIDAATGSAVRVTARNSNYNSVSTSLSTGTDFTFTPAGTNGNQTAPPQLVDPAGGDFHQLPTSPTIAAGLGDPISGALDLDGAPRIQGPCAGFQLIDIGAYEAAAAPCPPVVPWSGTVAGKVKLGKPKLLPGKGAALLPVTVSAGGTVVLGGKGVVRRDTVAHRAGTRNLLVKAKGRKAKALRRLGKVTLRPAVTFTPFGGTAATGSQPLTLKLQRPGKRASR